MQLFLWSNPPTLPHNDMNKAEESQGLSLYMIPKFFFKLHWTSTCLKIIGNYCICDWSFWLSLSLSPPLQARQGLTFFLSFFQKRAAAFLHSSAAAWVSHKMPTAVQAGLKLIFLKNTTRCCCVQNHWHKSRSKALHEYANSVLTCIFCCLHVGSTQ